MSDLIDREAVISLIDEHYKILDEEYGNICINKLNELPPVEPSRRKGHWIEVTNGRGGHECDKCHGYAPSYQDGSEYLTDFCPNCGADMRGTE